MDSLTNRLRTTPFLIEEVDGLTICEPLQFIPVASGSHPGGGTVGGFTPFIPDRAANSVSRFHSATVSEKVNQDHD